LSPFFLLSLPIHYAFHDNIKVIFIHLKSIIGRLDLYGGSMKYLNYALIMFSIMACSSLDKKDCSHLDWQKQGFEDGTEGRRRTYYLQHSTYCLQAPDRKAYFKGRTEGLHLFCTKKSGFNEGLTGALYLGQCDDVEKERFLKGYKIGKGIYDQKEDISDISQKIKDKESEISYESQDEDERDLFRSELKALKKELIDNKKILRMLENRAHQKNLR